MAGNDAVVSPAMQILRTDDSCFDALPDYPFAPNYLEFEHLYGALRMHYIDEGPRDASHTILLVHGEPSWSYLYRKMIPSLVAAGYRCVAPDLIGFGKSDKLPLRSDYTYLGHVQRVQALVEHLDLQNIVSFGQDWGGPITLSQVGAMPERFAAIVLANTLLPNCEPPPNGIEDWPGDAILGWVQLGEVDNDLQAGAIIQSVTVTELSDAEVAAYDAPFPDASYKAGIVVFPQLIPIHPDKPGIAENRRTWEVLEQWQKPCLLAFSDQDPSTIAWREVFARRIPGAANHTLPLLENGGHMLQEDVHAELVEAVLALAADL